jgi:hypothetical protein
MTFPSWLFLEYCSNVRYVVTMPKDGPKRITLMRLRLAMFFRRLFTRKNAANLLMLSFIVLTSVGIGLTVSTGWGLVVAGVTSGIFGFLLGLE